MPSPTALIESGKTYTLNPSQMVIADDTGPESLAGIMGGEASGCTPETTDVFLESAFWDPITIAATGRALKINSDARYRFERGVVSVGDGVAALVQKSGRQPDRIVTLENSRGAAVGERWEYYLRDKQVNFTTKDGRITGIEEIR